MNMQQAVDHFGSKAKVARKLGLSKPAVSAWGDEIPMLRQYQLAALSRGKLKVDQPEAKPAA